MRCMAANKTRRNWVKSEWSKVKGAFLFKNYQAFSFKMWQGNNQKPSQNTRYKLLKHVNCSFSLQSFSNSFQAFVFGKSSCQYVKSCIFHY